MKYPKEIANYFTKTKTFSVEAHFSERKEEDDRPLMIFDDTFSRFALAIIDRTSSDKKIASCNLKIGELPSMRAATDFASQRALAQKYKETQETGIAYTTRFSVGMLKGKSPADVLAEQGEAGRETLDKQYKFLSDNQEKYPNNKYLMAAIKEALKLNPEGIKSSSLRPVEIMNPGVRPLVRKKDEKGNSFCYEACITWDDSRNYPVNIRISNYYAPVREDETGMLNVIVSEKDKDSEINVSVDMSIAEWLEILRKMESARDGFEITHYSKAFKVADEALKSNIFQAKGESA